MADHGDHAAIGEPPPWPKSQPTGEHEAVCSAVWPDGTPCTDPARPGYDTCPECSRLALVVCDECDSRRDAFLVLGKGDGSPCPMHNDRPDPNRPPGWSDETFNGVDRMPYPRDDPRSPHGDRDGAS